MKFNEIENIVKMMKEYALTEFKIETEECKLSISRSAGETASALPQVVIAPAPQAAVPQPAAAPQNETPEPASEVQTIDSPLVGTFFHSSSPDAKPFVAVGDRVGQDTVVGIIEAMKVMNEIKAGKSGIISEILVDNGCPVEFGQALFVIK